MPPDQSSGMYPVWNKTAREFADRLDKIGSGKAMFLAKRMREFAAVFDSWVAGQTPKGDEKSKVIGDYMTCYRDALDVFSKKP